MNQYFYDGSFEGLLSAIFEAYVRRDPGARIRTMRSKDRLLFGAAIDVETDLRRVARVERRLGPEVSLLLYRAFLADVPGIENLILRYIRALLAGTNRNPLDEAVLQVERLVKQVGREVHRMHAFVRFEQYEDDTYVAHIAPDFNVLPLIGDHFADRYPALRWMIVDVNRSEALCHQGGRLEIVTLEEAMGPRAEGEGNFQQLWRAYFQAVNIPERRNMKLHLRHVPRRYWRYLPEKHVAHVSSRH